MDRYREKTSTLFTRIANGLGRKQRPVVVPLSKSLGHPAPQTSLIFQLPDELILSILSCVSPDPQLTRHYARFRVQYSMEISNSHERRVQFLLPLSMTSRAMRARLLPWIWERVECLKLVPRWSRDPEAAPQRGLRAIVDLLPADKFLAANVKFMTLFLAWGDPALPPFVRCLESLPNLHTLEIGRAAGSITTPLKNALKNVRLPQITTLIIPPEVYPLLQCCCDVEDVVCVTRDDTVSSDEFLGALASNRDSRVRRLAIPLVSWGNPSRHVAALLRLTELTLIYPHPHVTPVTETGTLLDTITTVHSATLELANACRALPDFDTLQIVHFLLGEPLLICGFVRASLAPTAEQEQALRGQVKAVKDLAIDSLKKAKVGCWEGEGRKKVVVRVIELIPHLSLSGRHLSSVKAEEFEV